MVEANVAKSSRASIVRSRAYQRGIAGGAALAALGLVIAGTAPIEGTAPAGTAPAASIRAPQTAGGALAVVGWLLLVLSIHRFGRESRPD